MEDQMARKRAQELIKEAEGEMKTFWMWRTKDNFYNAGKAYQNAAVQYKICKDYQLASETYLKAAEIFDEKAEDKMQATLSWNEAGVCAKFFDVTKAAQCYMKAAQSYQQMNRWSPCAKLYDEIAVLYENDLFDTDNAIKCYIKCGESYLLAKSPTSAHGAYLKAANLYAEKQQFFEAIKLYEVNAEHYAKQGGAMAHQVNNNAYRALICMMVQEAKVERLGDLTKTREKYEEYCSRFPTFDGDDNARLIDELINAYHENDVEAFQTALGKRRYKLDQWSIDRLVNIKRALEGTLDVGGTAPQDKPMTKAAAAAANAQPTEVTAAEQAADDLL